MPEYAAGFNLQKIPKLLEFGKRGYQPGDMNSKAERRRAERELVKQATKGSEKWVALQLGPLDSWPTIQRLLNRRNGKLPNSISKEDVIEAGLFVQSELKWRWPIQTSESGPTDRVGFKGCFNPFCVYTGGRLGGPLFEAAVTYENTTEEFAAAVMGSDPQGLKVLYFSLAPEARTIGLVPWQLEPGAKYKLVYGPDEDDDGEMNSITSSETLEFPQPGSVFKVDVLPRVNYVIEIDQVTLGTTPALAPDPAVGPEDVRLFEDRLMVRVHNIGSAPVRNVWVEAYDGDPAIGGVHIGRQRIPHIAAPLDLDPKTTTVSWRWKPTSSRHEIHVVIDPQDTVRNEISSFNNVTKAILEVEGVESRKSHLRLTADH
jgi:hypothetical protein